MTGQSWVVKDKTQAEFFCTFIHTQVKENKEWIYALQRGGRTNKQNRAAHLCFRNLAEALNDAGFGIPHPLNAALEIPYTEESVKELLYRPVIRAMYNKTSTADLETKELTQSFDAMLNRVAEVTGVVVHFPQHELA